RAQFSQRILRLTSSAKGWLMSVFTAFGNLLSGWGKSVENTMLSPAPQSIAYLPGASSDSMPTKHWRLKYSDGGRGTRFLTMCARASQCSSIRHSQNGTQLQLPSRNA